MKTVSITTSKKIGLISAMSIFIGTMVGVGIFFKNDNVFEMNNFNTIGILIAWVISGIISLSAAFCFAEVGSSKHSRSGLGGWFEVLIGPKSGRLIKIIQPLFYFSIFSFSIGMFGGEAIFNIWNASASVNFGIIMLISLVIYIGFLFLNFFAFNASAKMQIVITSLKFVPMAMVILGGLIYGGIHPELKQ